MTIVVVTHELESAFKIADTITVLDQGNILMTGTVVRCAAPTTSASRTCSTGARVKSWWMPTSTCAD